MAALIRRTWAQLKTEHITRAGQTNRASYASRAERFLEVAERDLALRYHQPEMDALDASIVCSTVNPYITAPTDLYSPIGIVLRDPVASAIIKSLNPAGSHNLFAAYDGTATIPSKYSRYGSLLYFDTIPDAAYKVDLYYYKLPTAPDFSGSASPAIGEAWDERILDLSLARAMGVLWRPDHSVVHAELLKDFLAQTVQRPLIEVPLPEVSKFGVPSGGPQG